MRRAKTIYLQDVNHRHDFSFSANAHFNVMNVFPIVLSQIGHGINRIHLMVIPRVQVPAGISLKGRELIEVALSTKDKGHSYDLLIANIEARWMFLKIQNNGTWHPDLCNLTIWSGKNILNNCRQSNMLYLVVIKPKRISNWGYLLNMASHLTYTLILHLPYVSWNIHTVLFCFVLFCLHYHSYRSTGYS